MMRSRHYDPARCAKQALKNRSTTTVSSATQDLSEHFAYCVQVLGGMAAATRRLGIDERSIRRFANGERPVSARLMQDTAQALQVLIAEAAAAEEYIAAALGGAN